MATDTKTRPATLGIEEMQRLIAEGVAAALAEQAAKQPKPAAGKSAVTIQNEAATLRAFKAKGYSNVILHQDVKTYSGWVTAGFKVKRGEHSTHVKSLRLFHRSQVEAVSGEELAALKARQAEIFAKHQARKTAKPQSQRAA